MNERLPYEEQLAGQWSSTTAGADFLLPDENLAWADMRRRLDEDREKRPFAWWRWGCLGWALLGILAIGAGWYFLQSPKQVKEEHTNKGVIPEQQPATGTNNRVENGKRPISTVPVGVQQSDSDASSKKDGQKQGQNKTAGNKQAATSYSLNPVNESGNSIIQSVNGKKQKKTSTTRKNVSFTGNKKGTTSTTTVVQQMSPIDTQKTDTVKRAEPVLPQQSLSQTVVKNDTGQVQQQQSIAFQKSPQKTDSVPVKTAKKQDEPIIKDKSGFVFSAGAGLHQQIPLGGQTFTPYSSAGRKASLADYIPTIYLRLEKEKKWFLQGEFRYGAPQYTKQFTYRQQLVPDTGANPQYSTLTAYGLKKTFYHQLPLSFHYFIRPDWSIGAGMQWNLFQSAVAERTINRKNNFTQIDSLVSRSIFKENGPGSLFRKSYWQAVVESQYKWNRLSFGARYAFGLQPYIQFTLPGQASRQERNHALQLFLRYELWRQKGK
jgi:hypothetical protein